jgi:hemerythrin-like domain-containing protein
MNPTTILMNEHRVIEQVLNCLEVMASRAEDGQMDGEAASQAIDFFRTFADRCHHGKEETHLFPALEAKGMPKQGGPTGVMRYEHDLGRRHLTDMQAAVDSGAATAFAQAARHYVVLLREHIRKEDHCLFPMADSLLTGADRDKVLAAFDHVESDEMHAGTHEKYLRLADELADRFGVPHAGEASGQAAGAACGCGHSHR